MCSYDVIWRNQHVYKPVRPKQMTTIMETLMDGMTEIMEAIVMEVRAVSHGDNFHPIFAFV